MERKLTNSLVTGVGIAICYFVSGKLGLLLACVHPSATAVWPPTGIAFAAVLILGYRFWPGIFLGAFLVNWTTAGSVATSMGIATGNTLEALLGAYLVSRFAGGRRVFDRPADVFRFVLLAGMLSTLVSATIGVGSLAMGGFAPWKEFGSIWMTWWIGDATGHFLASPLLILFANRPRLYWRRRQYFEAALLASAVVLLGNHVFLTPFEQSRDSILARVCVPLLAWTAFRFGRRETAILMAALPGIALWGTIHGLGPFALQDPNESLLHLQTFMGIIGITAMLMAACTYQWRRSQFDLARLNGKLELEVCKRTEQLRASEARFIEAQEVARIGSWEWDIPENRITWSRELYRIHGVSHERFNPTYEGFLELQHTEDRDRVMAVVESAYKTGEPFSYFHRIIRPDNEVRTLHGCGKVVKDGVGRPIRMAGTCQDVTETKKLERAVKESQESFMISRRLLQDEEAQRRRVAQDLHDSVNQLLVSLKFCLESLLRRLPRSDNGANSLAQEARSTLETTIGEVRRICRNLRPAVLDDLGFLAAMRSTCQELGRRTGLRIRIRAPDFPNQLPSELETILFRIMQETLNNAVQHSGATELAIALSCVGGRVKIVVTDDGKGFSLDPGFRSDRTGGSGLSNMRERAALAGGEVSIVSSPGTGTRVEINLPIALPAAKELALNQ